MADERVPPAAGHTSKRESGGWGSRFPHRLSPPVAIAIAVAGVEMLLYRPLPIGVVQDDGLYAILAKALATGQGYRFLNLPGAPDATHFPPGFPAMLALLWHVFPSITATVLPFALVNLALLGFASGALYLLVRRLGVGPPGSAVAALAGFLMPPALALGTTLLSEPLWLATTIPWLLAADAFVRRNEGGAPAAAFILGLGAGAIALVRMQAVALTFALVLVLAVRRRWKPAGAAAVGALVLLLPWQLWVSQHAGAIPAFLAGKYGAYGPWFADGLRADGARLVIGAISRNLSRAGFLIGGMFALPGVSPAASWCLLVPAVAGGRRILREHPVMFVALLVHAAIILVWPFEPQRFVWGSWPFIAMWLVAGAAELRAGWLARRERAAGHRPSGAARAAVAGVAMAVAAWLTIGAVTTTALMMITGEFRNIARGGALRLEPTVDWVAQHTPPGAVIASDDETAVYLFTGRRAVPTSDYTAAQYLEDHRPNAPPTVLDSVIARYHPDFVIAYWKPAAQAAERLASGPSPVLTPIERMPGGAVFARANPGPAR